MPELWGMTPYGLGQLVALKEIIGKEKDSYGVSGSIIQKLDGLIVTIVAELYKNTAQLERLPSIDDIINTFQPTDNAELQRMLERGQHEPVHLMHFGRNILDILAEVAKATLKEAGDAIAGSSISYFDLIQDYQEKIVAANKLVAEALGPQEGAGLIAAFRGRRSTKIDKKRYLELLENAQDIMVTAGKALSAATTPLAEKQGRLERAIGQAQKTVDFYGVLANEIAGIRDVGDPILQNWKKAAEETTQQSPSIGTLSAHLSLLEAAAHQINTRIAHINMQAGIDALQLQSLNRTRDHTLPGMIQGVVEFISQIDSFRTAATIGHCTDAKGHVDTSQIPLRTVVLQNIAKTLAEPQAP